MPLNASSHGQSALEYLFLLAGGVIIVIIILLSVIGLTPLGQSFLGTNIQEYEEIDVCTGQTADCSLDLDWGVGVQTTPVGVELINTTWRDLYIDGFGLELQCYTPSGYVPCTQNNFFVNSLVFSFQLPVQSGTCTDVSAPGNPPIYDCAPCDPDTSSCLLVPGGAPFIPMCPLAAPNACTVPVVPFSTVSTPPNAGFILKARESREVAIGIGGDFEGKGNTKKGYITFRVTQVKPNTAAPGTYDLRPNTTGTKRTNALGYYSSWNYYTGSFHVCQNLNQSIANHNFYWCDGALGVTPTITNCGYDTSNPQLSTPSNAQAYFAVTSNQSFDLSNNQGEVVHLDVSPLAASGVVANYVPQLAVEFSNFTNSASPCWNQPTLAQAQTQCNAACTNYLQNVGSALRFYRISPTTPATAWCDKLANVNDPAVTPIAATLSTFGTGPNPGAFVLADSAGLPVAANCAAVFSLPSLAGISNPQNYFVGVRINPGTTNIASFPRANSTLRGHWDVSPYMTNSGPSIAAFTLTP